MYLREFLTSLTQGATAVMQHSSRLIRHPAAYPAHCGATGTNDPMVSLNLWQLPTAKCVCHRIIRQHMVRAIGFMGVLEGDEKVKCLQRVYSASLLNLRFGH
jgi:hypothetical protein